MLPVFVYGTLRAGSWNHDDWLRPWLDPTVAARPATLAGHALHQVLGLPAVTPAPGRTVVGEVVRLRADRHDEALRVLDDFEGVPAREYERHEVEVDDGTRAWCWLAGPAVLALLRPDTEVASGDWRTVEVPS